MIFVCVCVCVESVIGKYRCAVCVPGGTGYVGIALTKTPWCSCHHSVNVILLEPQKFPYICKPELVTNIEILTLIR